MNEKELLVATNTLDVRVGFLFPINDAHHSGAKEGCLWLVKAEAVQILQNVAPMQWQNSAK
jgi:hypothetical protein